MGTFNLGTYICNSTYSLSLLLKMIVQVLFVVALISSGAMSAPTDNAKADPQPRDDTADLQAAGGHLSVYGGLGELGYGGYGGYGHVGYGGYGHGGYGSYGGHHGGYGSGYGNSYGHSGYTSINKVVKHGSHGHAGGFENGGYGDTSYGGGYYKK